MALLDHSTYEVLRAWRATAARDGWRRLVASTARHHASYGPNPRALGHDGFGGSCGLADPETELSLGYVMNRMGLHIADDLRKMALVEAVYAAL